MSLPYALAEALPADLPAASVEQALRCSGSPGSAGGETWLLQLDTGVAVLTRSSLLDALARLDLARPPELLKKDFETKVRIEPRTGAAFEVRPSLLEVDRLGAMLGAQPTPAAAPGSEPELEPEPPGPIRGPEAMGPPVFGIAAAAGIEGLREEIAMRKWAAAATSCRAQAQVEKSEAANYREAALVCERLAAGEARSACMLAFADEFPTLIHDAMCGALYDELARAGEPLLALEVHDWIWSEGPAKPDELKALARSLPMPLDEDDAERRVKWAQEVLAHFAADQTPVGLRGRANALHLLDRTEEALALLREAAAREPDRFATQWLLANLLDELDQTEAWRTLVRDLVDRFADHPDPPRSLAESLSMDDHASGPMLAEASRHYANALEREFDEEVVLDFARLLERTDNQAQAISLLEAAYASTTAEDAREDFSRELARLQRGQSQPQQAERWTAATKQHVAKREQSFAVAAIALVLVMLGAVMAFLLAQ